MHADGCWVLRCAGVEWWWWQQQCRGRDTEQIFFIAFCARWADSRRLIRRRVAFWAAQERSARGHKPAGGAWAQGRIDLRVAHAFFSASGQAAPRALVRRHKALRDRPSAGLLLLDLTGC